MKILTLNFLTCARKACKPSPDSFPLHPKEVVLETVEADLNALFLSNILPRLEWPALLSVCNELGLPGLVDSCPEPVALFDGTSAQHQSESQQTSGGADDHVMVDEKQHDEETKENNKEPSQLARDLHRLLIETCISEGKLVCGNCGHEYAVKEGIANFLLPPHLV